MQVLTAAVPLLVSIADDVPEPEDVKAGWLAFGIFIVLILAVAFLGWSLVKQLRKVDAAEEAGLYDPSDKPKPVRIPVEEPAQGPGQPSTQASDDRPAAGDDPEA